MTWVSFLSFTILLIIIVSTFKHGADVFSPARVFGFIWSMAIGLAELKFSRFQHEWSDFGWLVLILSVASFMLGIFIIYVTNINVNIVSINNTRKLLSEIKIDRNRFFNIIVIVFIVYIVSYAVNTILTGFIPFFHYRPSESRVYWGVFGFGLLVHTAPAILYFITQYYKFINKDRLRKIILALIALVTFITYFFLLQRFYLIVWLVITLVFLFYSSNYLRLRNAFFVIFILSGLMYSVQFIRMSKFVADFLYYSSEMKFGIEYAIFTEPYMYVAMNLENFARAVTKNEVFTFGFYSFNPIMSISGLKHWIDQYANLNDKPFLNSTYNTYSMFWDYYRDFGLLGVSILPLLLGMIVSMVYYKMRSNPSLNLISLYGLFVFIMIISFFLNAPAHLHFVFNILLIYFVTKYIDKHTIYRPMANDAWSKE